MSDLPAYVRVRFEMPVDAWHGYASEGVWAEPVADGRYRLGNIPFYVRGVSVGDVVFAEDRGGQLVFTGVSIRSGHSTYRIFSHVAVDSTAFTAAWDGLRMLGCTYERAQKSLLAVDVPSHANIHRVYALLERGAEDETWAFEEGHCGHPVESQREDASG